MDDFYYSAHDILDRAIGTDAYFQIKSILTGMKAADVVEVRHGRWEKHPQSNEDDPVYTCSLCKLNVSGFEKRWIKYCPNCGARMGKEADHD